MVWDRIALSRYYISNLWLNLHRDFAITLLKMRLKITLKRHPTFRRLGGKQINHHICLTFLNMTFWPLTIQTCLFRIWTFFYIIIRSSSLKGGYHNLKMIQTTRQCFPSESSQCTYLVSFISFHYQRSVTPTHKHLHVSQPRPVLIPFYKHVFSAKEFKFW